jgi:hypothetical protein
VNAGTIEEKTDDSSSAVHIKKVTFFLQETVQYGTVVTTVYLRSFAIGFFDAHYYIFF